MIDRKLRKAVHAYLNENNPKTDEAQRALKAIRQLMYGLPVSRRTTQKKAA